MPRRSGPTLLELASRTQRAPTVAPPRTPPERPERRLRVKRERPAPEPAEIIDDAPSIPRIVRVPVGYLFIAGALVVALMVGGYLVGYRRASSALRDRERALAQRELETAVQDPLLSQAPVNPGLLPSAGRSATNPTSTPTTDPASARSPQQGGAAPAAAPGEDPRTPGLNYFIVARDLPEEAERAAAFLRDNGVPAFVATSNNAGLRLLIALEGFTSEAMRAGEHLPFKARLQSLGRIWKRDHAGATDWADAYPARYSG